MNIQKFSENITRKSEIFADIISACSTLLKYHPSASSIRPYLDSRCSKYYQDIFGFGYFPNFDDLQALIELLGGTEKLEEVGLINNQQIYFTGIPNKSTYLQLQYHNLILPYKNAYGDIIGIVGRTLLSEEEQKEKGIPKYKNTDITKNNHLFGLNKAKNSIIKKDCVILVEGQFDFISCYRYGFQNTVAVGCANLSKNQFYLLKRYTNNFYFLFDNDKAGQKGFQKAQERFKDKANINKINIPEKYKDVDEYLKNSNDYSVLESINVQT